VFNQRWTAWLLVLLAGTLVYTNSFSVPFLFDDGLFIVDPRTRQFFWPPWKALLPLPYCEPFMYRPLVLFSLALNYNLGGLNPWGYHLVNLGIHLLNALLLMELLRRTLQSPRLRDRFGPAADEIALAVALLWVVHPLLTQSVTYLWQRAESLAGLFILLTLHGLIRSVESPYPRRWKFLTVAACAVGMAGKQTMVIAPLLALTYDRIFIAGSWRNLASQRKKLYLALGATWGILPLLLAIANNGVPSSAGPAYFTTMGPWAYARTQPSILLHYLRMVFWPHPLILDYGWAVENNPAVLIPSALAVGGLLLATLWALRRRPELGFLGIWFFLILAPVSSFLPCKTMASENRMYLPLAAVITLGVLSLQRARQFTRIALLILAVTLLGTATFQRNQTYRDPVALWAEVAANRPANALAYYNLGFTLQQRGRIQGASLAYRETIRLDPTYDPAYVNLGLILHSQGRSADALELYLQAVRINPGNSVAHNNIGTVLFQQGKWADATAWFSRAVLLDPGYIEAHRNLGAALKLLKQTSP